MVQNYRRRSTKTKGEKDEHRDPDKAVIVFVGSTNINPVIKGYVKSIDGDVVVTERLRYECKRTSNYNVV